MCPGQNVTVGSEVFDESRLTGDVTLTSSTNCDSIVHVSLTYPDNTGTYSANVCQGDTANILGEDFYVGRTTSVIKRTSSFGCDSFITVTVTIIPSVQGTFNAEICRDDTIIVGAINGVGGEPFFSGKTTGSITLTNRAANGCDSIIDVDIAIRPDAIGTFDTTMCENQTRTIYGQTFSLSRPKGSFRVDDVATHGCDSFIMVNITFIPAVSGTFRPVICRNGTVDVHGQTFSASNPTGSITLPGGSAFGCDSIINVQVSINPPIFADLQTTELICNQANTGELTLTDIRGGSGNFKISIDGGSQVNYNPGISIGDLSSGTHTIRIIDQLGCDTTYNFTINNSQVLDLRVPADTTIKKGNVVNISASINFNATKIIWDPSTYLDCDTCLTTVSTPDNTIKYTLTVTDEKGCIISGSFTINVIVDIADIYVPNVFSPNGDNINDDFAPVFKIPEKTRILIFQIFDRWGNLIYERTNGAFEETFGWDGSVDQEKMNPGVYTYIIQFVGEDGQAKWKLGDVTLIR
jgi:gliding motility-associated-like protein